ncbi:hypothetical protein Kisp01_65550 [Kineosporia sp. NBRC 101677]|uniref:hypothetical protein n=1 Tax=Kineosporia sp. NBRC 101677 TaxID=3032197 RepID=UPI00249FD44B|nr:hypothetical protein [Kineosporia sp. NBRC 101677]GLY19541.1 hypothetical protein Kisp01_65550 [Kineosporia sp. NBRC 101677]
MHAETLQNLRYCAELFGVMAFAFCGAFQAVSMAAAFLLRVLALHGNWRIPRSLLWNEPAPPVTADHRRRRSHRLPVAH